MSQAVEILVTDADDTTPSLIQVRGDKQLQALRVLVSDWGHVKYDFPDANTIYIGAHKDQGAATDDSNWRVWKITLSAGNPTDKERIIGAWDSRATLDWA
jgi:hypothetical protein